MTQPLVAQVTPEALSQAALRKASLVAEFEFIQKKAKQMGVKVYLFGGSAAAYAHYVRWDLERLNGDTKHQPERFDYDFTNIYRGNQDLDLVVDGTEKEALALQEVLQKEYPHFVGDKQSWEVRLLRHAIGDKLPLLDDPDFKNQHTDTNSTGMLDLTASKEEPVFRDLLDWENEESQFLKDVASARITYLFNPKHKETSRFQDGKNPPIFSAVRYLAKLTQYEVQGTKEDLKKIQEIIEHTNFSSLSSYVKFKLSEFATKTLLNSPNSEYAWNLMDELGLRKKLIQMDGSRFYDQESLSWWLNKEPLRTKEFGTVGKTARELFGDKDIIVSHETNSFLAYENITRSSRGEANAFISREGGTGEAAVHGDGFYTALGQHGARGTGLTIRFILHPEARKGHDFIVNGDYVIVNNKKALTLIQENINIHMIDFLKIMKNDEISSSDKGLLEKFKRKFKRVSSSSQEFQEAFAFVKEHLIASDHFSKELSNFSLSTSHIKRVDDLLDLFVNGTRVYYEKVIAPSFRVDSSFWLQNPGLLRKIVDKGYINYEIIKDLLSKQEFVIFSDIVEKFLFNADNISPLIKFVFSQEHWMRNHKLIEKLINRIDDIDETESVEHFLVIKIFQNIYWQKHHQQVFHFLYHSSAGDALLEYVFSDPYWILFSSKIEDFYFEHPEYDEALIEHIFSNPLWPKNASFFKRIFERASNSTKDKMSYMFFQNLNWIAHSDLTDELLDIKATPFYHIISIIENREFSPQYYDLIQKILIHNSTTVIDRERVLMIALENREWRPHAISLIESQIGLNQGIDNFILEYFQRVLANGGQLPFYRETLHKLMIKFLQNKRNHSLIAKAKVFFEFNNFKKELVQSLLDSNQFIVDIELIKNILPYAYWAQFPEFIEILISRNNKDIDLQIVKNIFIKPHWMKHPYLLEILIHKPHMSEHINFILQHLFLDTKWSEHTELILKIIKMKNYNKQAFRVIKNKKPLINNPQIIEALIQNSEDIDILKDLVFLKDWHFDETLFKKVYSSVSDQVDFFIQIFTKTKIFENHPEIMIFATEFIEPQEISFFSIFKTTFKADKLSTFIAHNVLTDVEKNPPLELLLTLIEKKTVNKLIDENVLILNYWKKHPLLKALLNGASLTTDSILNSLRTVNLNDFFEQQKINSHYNCRAYLGHQY